MTRNQRRTTISSARRATLITAAVAGLLVTGACQPDEEPATTDTAADTAAGGMAGMGDMRGMAGTDHGAMKGMMEGGGMMDQMQGHMRMMDSAGADGMAAMMPMHRQMVANMIAQFNREMRDMNMQTDAAWTATVDSLRRDLVRLPELSGGELQSFMPEHHGRMMRLMEMHRTMMQNMKM